MRILSGLFLGVALLVACAGVWAQQQQQQHRPGGLATVPAWCWSKAPAQVIAGATAAEYGKRLLAAVQAGKCVAVVQAIVQLERPEPEVVYDGAAWLRVWSVVLPGLPHPESGQPVHAFVWLYAGTAL